MPGQRARLCRKASREGATVSGRGAQGTRMLELVEVKREVGGDEAQDPALSQHNRQLLRTAILGRREAQGLGHIHVSDAKPVKHELTPEEVEKKERRKEQNRRAARKCRLKKRVQQSSVVEQFSVLVDNNRAREQEVSQLRAELAHLTKAIHDHNNSGLCRAITLPRDTCHSHDFMPFSPISMASTASPASSMTSEDCPAPPTMADADESTSAQHDLDLLDIDSYLQDLGPILPDQTFTDLDTYKNLDDLDNIPSQELIVSSATLSTEQPQQQQGHEQPPPPPYPLPDLLLTEFEPSLNLRAMKASSPRAACQFSPVSPATNAEGRLSTSSQVSDWSAWTEGSQGFSVVPGSVHVASPMSEETEVVETVDDDSPAGLEDQEDDDVFIYGSFHPC